MARSGPLQREIQILVRGLLVFLAALITALLLLVLSLLAMNRPATLGDEALTAIAPLARDASRSDLQARLNLLVGDNGITRIEVYRDEKLYAAVGTILPSAEVVSRSFPRGRMLIYFDMSSWVGGKGTALVVAACATLGTMTGVLLLILYIPKFVRPIEEMLDHARQLGARDYRDDDARYLVHSFREAVERIQQQAHEIDNLRDVAGGRSPDIRALAETVNRNVSSGFIAVDAGGSIVALNDIGRAMLRQPLESELPSVSMAMLPSEFAAVVESSLASRTAVARKEIVLDETESLIGITTVPLFEENRFLGLFGLFTDLTTIRAMEGRVRDLENLVGLGQVSAGIAHEFRNSLFTILGYLRLAQRSASPECGAKIASAESEAHRLAGAVDTLLNFASPLNIRRQRVRLDELAQEVVDRAAAGAANVTFRVSGSKAEVHGDRELLARAIENIVRNAVDAVQERHPNGGGIIEVEVQSEPHPRIDVRDNGVGLQSEDIAKLTLPFVSAKAKGFGLGLPLARKIALHHGATLSLTGVPDQGATVTIEFFA
jgi:signal transduction histidine kinase